MPLEKYRALVDRLEDYARNNPMGYRLKLLGLAALGYGYIFALLAILVGLLAVLSVAVTFGSVLFLQLAIPVGLFAFAVASALWVRIDPPMGRKLRRRQAPELFDALDGIRAQMDAPKIDVVLITPEFNAAISQVPRLGIFGWHKNYLLLGLPLLMTLSPDEFRAVIAHEFGHLSGNHSRFATWIYRVRTSWFQLVRQFNQGASSFLVRRFFKWFVPYFGAYSFVLARMNEYEADRASAEVAGAQTAGRALARVHVAAGYLSETFWPEVSRMNDRSARPPKELYVKMGDRLAQSVEADDAEVLLARELERPSGLNDTHPSLALRLEALGAEATVPPPAEKTAAEAYLGERVDQFIEDFNRDWYARVSQPWRHHYDQAQYGLELLKGLEDEYRDGEGGYEVDDMDDGDLFELAGLIERFRGKDEAFGLYEALVERNPTQADAHFAVGRILLDDDDPDGLEHIRRAITYDERYTADGGYLLAGYYLEREDYASAQPWLDKAELFEHKLYEARLEREQVLREDIFFPHGLDQDAVDALAAQLAAIADLGAAFLVAKEVEHFPEDPIYILGVTTTGLFSSSAKGQQVVNHVTQTVEFAVHTLIFDVSASEARWLKKKLKKVPGAQIV